MDILYTIRVHGYLISGLHFLFLIPHLAFNYLYFVVIWALVNENLNKVIWDMKLGFRLIFKMNIKSSHISLYAYTCYLT
jgi:hypothetical protein